MPQPPAEAGALETRIRELETGLRRIVIARPDGDPDTNGCTYGCTHGCTDGCTSPSCLQPAVDTTQTPDPSR